MTSQMVVNIDSKLKEKAMKMAKQEGLTMKALLSFLLKWYVKEEIVIETKISQHKRKEQFNIELEEFSLEEKNIIDSNKILKNAPWELNKLLLAKWI